MSLHNSRPDSRITVPLGYVLQVCIRPPGVFVVAAPPGIDPTPEGLIAPGSASGLFTHDEGVDWPDAAGVVVANSYLTAGWAICLAFNDVASALSCQARLRRSGCSERARARRSRDDRAGAAPPDQRQFGVRLCPPSRCSPPRNAGGGEGGRALGLHAARADRPGRAALAVLGIATRLARRRGARDRLVVGTERMSARHRRRRASMRPANDTRDLSEAVQRMQAESGGVLNVDIVRPVDFLNLLDAALTAIRKPSALSGRPGMQLQGSRPCPVLGRLCAVVALGL